MTLVGKVVVVTGANGVLGAAVARMAEEREAEVVRIDLNPSGGARSFWAADITDLTSTRYLMDRVRAQFGRLDALLNIAGGYACETLADGDPSTWDRMYSINVKTALNASKAALPHLLASGAGAIVNVAAMAALRPGPGDGAYAASKAGVMALTQTLSAELKGRVRVNAVAPSIIDTESNRLAMPEADPATWVSREELAKVMLFLASDEASAISGAIVPVVGRT
jgi:NAD(P)-dependent dehydrogenase (short-subunit alcohol dehydrogenase family)